jgi:hypothetical protein
LLPPETLFVNGGSGVGGKKRFTIGYQSINETKQAINKMIDLRSIYNKLVVLAGERNRVMSAPSPRMTSTNTAHGQPCAFPGSVPLDGIQCVLRTRRIIPTFARRAK